MEETFTLEQVQQQINAAFDSVNLISGEIAEINNRKDNIKRNYQHLEIMMAKEWFVAGCTEQQIIDINTSIAAGKNI
jgi:hypothetical protein